ncbi:MAG: NUDIX hydrolase [Patescibacteria group bacterium]
MRYMELVGETHSFGDWKKDPRFKEGDDIIYRAYAEIHGRDSDISKRAYEKSLAKENTLVRVISDLNERIQAIWYIRHAGDYLKYRSGAPRKGDLDGEERIAIYSKVLEMVPELDLPMVVEPDMRHGAVSKTFDLLGLSTVWCGEELRRVMGEDYERTHKFTENNKYGQAKFKVTNAIGRELDRRAYVSYPERMVKGKTIVRVMGVYSGFQIDDAGNLTRDTYSPMLRKDPSTSQTKQGNLHEYPGGNVDPDEEKLAAAEREFKEETGIDISTTKLSHVGKFKYQFWHPAKGGQVLQPETDVYRADFGSGKAGEWPKIVVVEGSEDRHSSGEWLSDKAIRSGEVELTRASNLMRLKF